MKKAVSERDPDTAGLKVGKFCEICLRLLQQVVIGSFTPFGKKIDNFADDCRKIITAQAPTIPESLRVVVPRALVFIYTMRSKRDIAHVGGDVDANAIDLATMVRTADWIICELIRIYHSLSLEEAQDLVDGISVRQLPDIWEINGKKRVLRPGLTAKQQTLFLLYHEPTSVVLAEDLCSWVEHGSIAVYRRDVLRPLHDVRLIEYDEENDAVHLSPPGRKRWRRRSSSNRSLEATARDLRDPGRNLGGNTEGLGWRSRGPRFLWLRGLDLNQRPLGYEPNTAMSGNPLILREKRSAASGSTLSDDASFFVSFHPVSGCHGSKMGAEIRAQSPRLSAASGVVLFARGPPSGSGRWMIPSRLVSARSASETPNRGPNFGMGSDQTRS